MNARLIKVWQDLQSSYYFIPGLMAVGAILLATLTSYIDRRVGNEFIRSLGWFSTNSTEGARAILSVIAGSMITVAGVTFSMTMVAVTSASAQFGPRLIGNFMRDRANQFTLGTFTATFVYCLMIMRVVRIGDEESVTNGLSEIVPHISLLVALSLTLLSVAVLIYFVHHIPETLNVGKITAQVGRRLREDVTRLFPNASDPESRIKIDSTVWKIKDALPVHAKAEGYLQALDLDTLVDIAQKNDTVIRLEYRPGDFCIRGNVIAYIWPSKMDVPDADRVEPIEHELRDKIHSCFAMGVERTEHQNALFLADELVEILARALSPGINDPFTAINCINWFYSALSAAAASLPEPGHRFDEHNQLRLLVRAVDFERFCSVICDQSRPYVSTDRNASLHMIKILTQLCVDVKNPDYSDILRSQLHKLHAAAQSQLTSPIDLEDLDERYKLALELIETGGSLSKSDSQNWFRGRA